VLILKVNRRCLSEIRGGSIQRLESGRKEEGVELSLQKGLWEKPSCSLGVRGLKGDGGGILLREVKRLSGGFEKGEGGDAIVPWRNLA